MTDDESAAADESADRGLFGSATRHRRWLRSAPLPSDDVPRLRPTMTPERKQLEMALAGVRSELLDVLWRHQNVLRSARSDERMSYDLIAARLGVRRHELLFAMIPDPEW